MELPKTIFYITKKGIPLESKPFYKCRRPESNRYGYHYPRDFKSRASASSATAAHILAILLLIQSPEIGGMFGGMLIYLNKYEIVNPLINQGFLASND